MESNAEIGMYNIQNNKHKIIYKNIFNISILTKLYPLK